MNFLIFLIVAVAATQAKYLVSSKGLSAAMEINEIDEDASSALAAMPTKKLYIPMAWLRTCNNNDCQAFCRSLGFNHGRCISETTCECDYN